jgi:RNA polymerase primary sigma factor
MAFDATIKEYLKEIDESPLLSAEEEYAISKKIVEDNDQAARERLVRSNLRLVVNIAKRYADRGMTLGDLIEEGNLGLIKAVDYFNPDRGTRFSTYAAWWIKQSIKRALLESTRPIQVPGYMIALINHWRHAAATLENMLGRKPDVEEMAAAMRLSLRKAKLVDHVVRILGSVREFSGSDDEDPYEQAEANLADTHTSTPEEEWIADEDRRRVRDLLDKIDPREADVLRLYYGLDGRNSITMKQIGEKLNLTRERIRQIQRDALTKLYEYMSEG